MTRQILLVDDEPLLLTTLTRALRRASSWEVAGVESVAAARESLEHFRPDLLICDLALGDGTGLDVIDLLRRHGLPIPIIILSGNVALYERSIPRGPSITVCHKPLPARELVDLVDNALLTDNARDGLGTFCVADYLQLAQFGRRSLQIKTRCDGLAGTLTLWQGEVWSASLGTLRGHDAVRRLLGPDAVALQTRTVESPPEERELEMPTHALLINTARLQDEDRRSGRNPTKPTASATAGRLDDALAAFVGGVARGQMVDAAQQLEKARAIASDDMRMTAWWCDAVLGRWSARPDSAETGGVG